MLGRPVRAVVFDLFDTLVDLRFEDFPVVRVAGRNVPSSLEVLHGLVSRHTEIAFDAFGDLLRSVDRELRVDHYDRGIELPTRVRFEHVTRRLGVASEELPEELTRAHMGFFLRHSPAPADAEPLLSGLREDGYRLGLCSNFSDSATAESVLETARLRAHLDAVVISDAARYRKPRVEIFERVLADLGVDPDETVHVGDKLDADVAGAAALGIRTVWITRRVPDPEASLAANEGPAPDARIGTLAELRPLLMR